MPGEECRVAEGPKNISCFQHQKRNETNAANRSTVLRSILGNRGTSIRRNCVEPCSGRRTKENCGKFIPRKGAVLTDYRPVG